MTAVVDMYPETFRRGYRRELLILGMSVVSFFIGLIMCTEVRFRLIYIILMSEDSRVWKRVLTGLVPVSSGDYIIMFIFSCNLFVIVTATITLSSSSSSSSSC